MPGGRLCALGAVIDPELDEPITDLGFVRSLAVDEDGTVDLHLRLPTSFCAPNFAYLMASDAKDVLERLMWASSVVVELDDHHDSQIINAGLAAGAGYRGTFGHEAENDHSGRGYAAADVPMALRRARSTRISIDGNAHFCRGLLRTRYPGSEGAQIHRADGAEPADAEYDPTFIPLATLGIRS